MFLFVFNFQIHIFIWTVSRHVSLTAPCFTTGLECNLGNTTTTINYNWREQHAIPLRSLPPSLAGHPSPGSSSLDVLLCAMLAWLPFDPMDQLKGLRHLVFIAILWLTGR